MRARHKRWRSTTHRHVGDRENPEYSQKSDKNQERNKKKLENGSAEVQLQISAKGSRISSKILEKIVYETFRQFWENSFEKISILEDTWK